MAFSQLARLQMADPMGMLSSELDQLTQLLNAAPPAGPAAIQDQPLEEGTALEAVNGGEDYHEDDDITSEPTEAERIVRQGQLDTDSHEYDSAVGLGIFDADGLEQFSDQTMRPSVPSVPTPVGTQHFSLAT